MNPNRNAFGAVPLLLAALAGQASAQCLFSTYRASDRSPQDQFGATVSVGNDIMAVGAWLDDNAMGTDAGSVYVFTRDLLGIGYSQTQRMQSPVSTTNQYFGRAVATDGTSILMGTAGGPQFNFIPLGNAYMYRKQVNGQFTQETFPFPTSIDGSGANFGSAVAVRSDIAVVGAPYEDFDDGSGPDGGAAYIYRRTGGVWGAPSKAIKPVLSSAPNDHLGTSVATNGSLVVVGVPDGNYTTGGTLNDAGSVMVFSPSGSAWNLSANLFGNAATIQADRRLGLSVAIDGTTIAAGAIDDDTSSGANSGAVYVFELQSGNWVQTARLVPSDAIANTQFGVRVAISGNRIAASAYGNDNVYLFRKAANGTWVQDRILRSSAYGAASGFGNSGVAVSGIQAFASDPMNSQGGMTNAGAAHALDLRGMGGDATGIADAASVGSTNQGCTGGATPTTSWIAQPCGQSANSNDVWYVLTPSQSQTVVIDTLGSSYDTVLGVYTIPQQFPVLTELACDDDSAGNFLSRIVMDVMAGGTYYVRVAGYNGAAGSFQLNVNAFCHADINGDGVVDFNDFLAYLNLYNAGSPQADLNGDGVVDFNDLLAFLNYYNAGC